MGVARCSNCGREVRVPEGFEGPQYTCPHCHSVFDHSPTPPVFLSLTDTAGPDGVPETEGISEREITREIRRRRRHPSAVVIGVAAIALGAVVVFVVTAVRYCCKGETVTLREAVAPEVAPPPRVTGIRGAVIPYVKPGTIVIDGRPEDWARVPMPEGEIGSPEIAQLTVYDMRKAGLAHDGHCLYVILEIHPGIDEYFRRTNRTASMGYLYVDSDGDEETGAEVVSKGPRGKERIERGFEWRAYFATGFAGGTNTETVAMAGYCFSPVERDGEFGYDAPEPELDRDTETDPVWVAAKGDYFEMRVLMAPLGLKPGKSARFLFEENGPGVFEKELLWGEVSGTLEPVPERLKVATDSAVATDSGAARGR